MEILDNEKIAKALTLGDSLDPGGALNREQQQQFVKMLMEHTTMLAPGAGIRNLTKTQASGQIDKMFLHGPVTQKAIDVIAEGGGTGDQSAVTSALYDKTYERFGQIQWDAVKLLSRTAWTMEFLRENIEQHSLETQLRGRLLQKMASDLEDLAINGNTALVLDSSPLNNLRRANMGWDVLSDSANQVDANGEFISRGLWVKAYKKLPRSVRRNRPNLKWFMNDDVEMDWMDLLAGRMDAVGSAAIGGGVLNPLGIPYLRVPLIPSDKSIITGEAVAGQVFGTEHGPFTFISGGAAGTGSLVNAQVDGLGAQPLNLALAAGGVTPVIGTDNKFTLTAAEVARSLNAQLSAIGAYAAYGNWVTVDPLTDRLVFTGVAKTAAADVTFGAANVHTCADVIGVPINTTDNGGVADPANAVNEGTFVWLSDPSNFLHITVTSDPGTNNQGIRTYSEFNKDRDRVEMITYAWTDALIEDTQSMVKIRDLRTQGIAI
jgi:hypothetical protein